VVLRSFCACNFGGPNFSVGIDTEICAIAYIPNGLPHYVGAIFAPLKFAYSLVQAFRVVAKLVVEGEHLMKNSGADWLSCTIRTVEQIMERHGFQEDEPNVEAPAEPVGNQHLSPWGKILRAARPLLRLK